MANESLHRDAFRRLFASRKSGFTLRMTPMIDMIFLLLIFFLVAAKWRPEENFLPFQLPAAQAQETLLGKPEPLSIYISAIQNGCKVQIGQQTTIRVESETLETNLAGLMEEIRSCLVSQKRYASDPVEIVCEPKVKWDYVAKIYNLFFGAGLSNITFQMTE